MMASTERLIFTVSTGSGDGKLNRPSRNTFELSEKSPLRGRRGVSKDVELSTVERIKLRCSPTYSIRWVRSKGAILVLLWNLLIVDYHGALAIIVAGILGAKEQATITIANNLIQALSLLIYPVAGWLADVYFGRYRVICSSLWLMWCGIIIVGVGLVFQFTLPSTRDFVEYAIFPLTLLTIECGIAGFKANAIPFGIDQLVEGSGDELSAFIHWFTFTIFFNIVLYSFPFTCFTNNSSEAVLMQVLLQATGLSIVLCMKFLLKDWLIIEPGTRNPFKVIFQVLRYAQKNKHPKMRSAFTYNNDKIPSRMDLAKLEYGGPFTTEQVEDVKTFLRILYVLVPVGAIVLISIMFVLHSQYLLADHFASDLHCVAETVISRALPFLVFLLAVPLYEFVVYPLLHNFIPSTLVRIGIGSVLFIANLLAQFTLGVIGQTSIDDDSNDTCLFTADYTLDVNFGWIALPGVIFGFAILFQVPATYEFVFAQSPYSMKGLFIGLIYGIEGVYQLLGILIQLPFLLGAVTTSASFLNCSSIRYILIVVILTAVLFWYVYVSHQYKRREREPPESYHVFAEEFYDKYLQKE